MSRLRVAVLGASGYTGADVIRLLLGHPHVEIVALSGERKAGQTVDQVWPHFRGRALPLLVRAEEINYNAVDVVFSCLPHGASQTLLAHILATSQVRVIDLSADFRLRDPATYAEWYGAPHGALEWQEKAVYGLSEFARRTVPGARLIACPGCYPTATLLALLPLLAARVIAPDGLTITALSGVSGAGRSLKEGNLFCEVAEAAHPYGLGHHRHMPEMEQELSAAAGQPVRISFTPHLVPMNRGELVTAIVRLTPGTDVAALRAVLGERYAESPFVQLLADGIAPSTRMVRGSNLCVLNAFADRVPGQAIVVSAIDNLVKGSSGQAVQNMNLAYGWPETLGLEAAPLFP